MAALARLRPLARVCPFVPSSTDRAVAIGFHGRLRNRLGNAAKKIAAVLLGQKLGKVHVGFGHRGLRIVAVDVAKLPLTVHLDGHLALHRRGRGNYTASSDTNQFLPLSKRFA